MALVMSVNTHIVMGSLGNTLAAEFAPEVRFDVRPNAARAERQLVVERLEGLKMKLVAEWMRKTRNPETFSVIRWAASEAVSLAWLSGMPLLTLPVLLDEKVAEALNRHARQKLIRARSEQLFLAA
ncbi:MAG: hypothetical protein K0Q55_794 [Verrucomicrobia bacterium]|nr:hypothetical protein [Verrucomicrobiota bacterium]